MVERERDGHLDNVLCLVPRIIYLPHTCKEYLARGRCHALASVVDVVAKVSAYLRHENVYAILRLKVRVVVELFVGEQRVERWSAVRILGKLNRSDVK